MIPHDGYNRIAVSLAAALTCCARQCCRVSVLIVAFWRVWDAIAFLVGCYVGVKFNNIPEEPCHHSPPICWWWLGLNMIAPYCRWIAARDVDGIASVVGWVWAFSGWLLCLCSNQQLKINFHQALTLLSFVGPMKFGAETVRIRVQWCEEEIDVLAARFGWVLMVKWGDIWDHGCSWGLWREEREGWGGEREEGALLAAKNHFFTFIIYYLSTRITTYIW